jgi:hypothetical protein
MSNSTYTKLHYVLDHQDQVKNVLTEDGYDDSEIALIIEGLNRDKNNQQVSKECTRLLNDQSLSSLLFKNFPQTASQIAESGQVFDITNKNSESGKQLARALEHGDGSSMLIKLPGDTEPTLFKYAEFKTTEEIDQNTQFFDDDNFRLQDAPDIFEDGLDQLIATFGQTIPAFGVLRGNIISPLDGSRRRLACMLKNSPYKIFYTEAEITPKQLDALQTIFSTVKAHSAYEVCVATLKKYENWSRKENNSKEVKDFAEYLERGYEVVSREIRIGKIDPRLYFAFPYPSKLSLTTLDTKVRKLISDLGVDESIIRVQQEAVNLEGKDDVDAEKTNLLICNRAAKSVDSEPVGRNNPVYLLGKRGSNTYLNHSTKDGITVIKAKIPSKYHQELNKLIENFASEFIKNNDEDL